MIHSCAIRSRVGVCMGSMLLHREEEAARKKSNINFLVEVIFKHFNFFTY